MMNDRVSYESLSREERLRRVGMLFSKAVTIIHEQKRLDEKFGSEISQHTEALRTPSEMIGLQRYEIALFEQFFRLGEFSPRDATQFWATSRTSCYRRLKKLEKEGWITKEGQTNTVRYRFTPKLKLGSLL